LLKAKPFRAEALLTSEAARPMRADERPTGAC
jgi:hypothetical protein